MEYNNNDSNKLNNNDNNNNNKNINIINNKSGRINSQINFNEALERLL